MIRALIGLLVAAIAAAFIRAVIGMITKEVKDMVNPEGPKPSAAPDSAGPAATQLKKCPVCGTYAPVGRLVNGQYCSQECAVKAAS